MPLFLLSVLLLTGCFRGCNKEEKVTELGVTPLTEIPRSSTISDETVIEEPTQQEEISSQGTEESADVQKDASSSSLAAVQAFVFDASGWAHELLTVTAHIGKLRAIGQGKVVLKEGEEPPDLHQEYAFLHQRLEAIVVPPEQSLLYQTLRDLDTKLGTIIQKLSSPPSQEELETANQERQPLNTEIQVLYDTLEEKQRETTH